LVGRKEESELKPKFKITDIVTSVINPDFLGQIITRTESEGQFSYGLTYFKDGEAMTITMFGFEIEPAVANKIGFLRNKDV
jgi:hypothetical protein